jgi:hypothetical protein
MEATRRVDKFKSALNITIVLNVSGSSSAEIDHELNSPSLEQSDQEQPFSHATDWNLPSHGITMMSLKIFCHKREQWLKMNS